MRIMSISRCGETNKKEADFRVGKAALVGIRYINANSVKGFGKAAIMFIFSNKDNENDAIFVQLMIGLEDQDEANLLKSNPYTINNWNDETRKAFYDPLVELCVPGKNSYGSAFIFNKCAINVVTKELYEFEAIYNDKETKTDTVRKVICDRGLWLQLSQFIYWIFSGYPASSDIFNVEAYNKAKMYKVINMTYDGCTKTVFAGAETLMAHFTLIYNGNGTFGEKFGFNIPIEPIKGKIENTPVDEESYVKMYSQHDTVSPDRIFGIFSPEKQFCLLSGAPDKSIMIFTIDIDTANKIKWMNWGEYIYGSKKKGIILV